MSEDKIATALGQIMGKIDALYGKADDIHDEFKRYVESHENRHRIDAERADTRHRVIDDKLDDHASNINQAKGAKAAVLLVASGLSALIAFVGKRLF